MVQFNLGKLLTLVICGLPMVWLIGSGWQHQLNAEPNLNNRNLFIAQRSPLPRRGEGVRCCMCPEVKVTLLVPKNEADVYLVELNASPTLLFEIPEIPENFSEIRAELLIVDKDFNEVYVKPLEIAHSQESVELEITLPNTLSIETGTDYYWKFAFLCHQDGDRTADSSTVGVLQFTAPKDSTSSE